jgi:hypothetical protein
MSLKSHDVLNSLYRGLFPILAGGIFIIATLNKVEMIKILSTLVHNPGYSKSGCADLKSVHEKIQNNINSISRCEAYATN